MQTYVASIIEYALGEALDKKIDDRISENIQSMNNTQIEKLF